MPEILILFVIVLFIGTVIRSINDNKEEIESNERLKKIYEAQDKSVDNAIQALNNIEDACKQVAKDMQASRDRMGEYIPDIEFIKPDANKIGDYVDFEEVKD